MTDPTKQPQAQEIEKTLSSRFPTAYTILFLLIIFVAALTWIIPAGKYDRVMSAVCDALRQAGKGRSFALGGG